MEGVGKGFIRFFLLFLSLQSSTISMIYFYTVPQIYTYVHGMYLKNELTRYVQAHSNEYCMFFLPFFTSLVGLISLGWYDIYLASYFFFIVIIIGLRLLVYFFQTLRVSALVSLYIMQSKLGFFVLRENLVLSKA